MPLVTDLSEAQMTFQVGSLEADLFEVIRYDGSEGLCQLYRFDIDVVVTGAEVTFASVVGQAGVLSINTPAGPRYFHGIVSRFEFMGQVADKQYFHAELVPSVWLLANRYNCRIFQDRTVEQIISDVLEKAGIPSDRFRFALSGQYDPREYCVQYRESDYNFICRLMEEEGMWWCFEQTREEHVLLIADAKAAYAPLGDEANVPFREAMGLRNDEEAVTRFRIGQAVRPGTVILNDFTFLDPALPLEVKAESERDAGLEFYDYPGEYQAQARGQTLVERRAQEFESARTVGAGATNSVRFAPGRTFTLTEHPAASLNASYLIARTSYRGQQATLNASSTDALATSLLDPRSLQAVLTATRASDEVVRGLAQALLQLSGRLRSGDLESRGAVMQWAYHAGQVSRELAANAAVLGEAPTAALAVRRMIAEVLAANWAPEGAPYSCTFECIPAALEFRPPRVTPWPVIRGTQTARIVGPQGEEIWCDELGRVKAQFHWHREGQFDDTSSCWIRVSQGFAGGAYGMLFLPRVGQEVIVDFIEGDPDQPIIVGRVYNQDHMPPYPLPDEKTKSCIKTHSSLGGDGTNEILFEDLKDSEQILIYAQKDLHIRVNNDRVENVDNNSHLTVKKDRFELIKENVHREIKLDEKNLVGGNFSLEVKGNVGQKFGGNHQEDADNIYLKGASNVVIEAGSALTLKVGGNFVKIDSSGVTILGTAVKINSGGSAGSGTAVAPEAPEAPIDAGTATPGSDTVYSGGQELAAATAPAALLGTEWQPPEDEERETSWLELELVDEAGEPVPNENYEVLDADGEVLRKGALDEQGRGRVVVPEAGSYNVRFPKLDADAWERA